MPLAPFEKISSPSYLPVTLVFCSVEGGRRYSAKYMQDARLVGYELMALMLSILRQVGNVGSGLE